LPHSDQSQNPGLCEMAKARLGVPADRVYITFMDFPAGNWGWNGSTFG
ncbi:MAG: hypothetical protein GX608_10790, partial [Lentisphaerae bacterium]|nr:hypothetical protein [Lentisphaerota bacterium]